MAAWPFENTRVQGMIVVGLAVSVGSNCHSSISRFSRAITWTQSTCGALCNDNSYTMIWPHGVRRERDHARGGGEN